MNKWENILIGPKQSIREALMLINKESLRVVLVVSDSKELLGIVTDGDIRRGLLNNLNLDAPVSLVMNASPLYASESDNKESLIETMENNGILSIPVLRNNKVVGLETLHHALAKPRYENPVFLMAGGFGKRLRPLTDNCPKPMLKVGSRPILETILINFISAGFINFYISTHYMPEKIRNHFGDGKKWGVNISYIHEEVPLGTGGALGLLPKSLPNLPLILMNGDLLTKVDFQRLLQFHTDNEATATMCVRDYEYQIPYGVITGEGIEIRSMEEKPIQRFFVNAGIYVVSPEIIQNVPKNQPIDMPTLLEEKMNKKHKILMFPVHEYWLDIGRMDDFNKAQADFYSLDLH